MNLVNHSLEEIKESFDIKREFFDNGNTRSYEFRKKALIKLKANIILNREAIIEALYNDFRKPRYEAYLTEVAVTCNELNEVINHLHQWMEIRHVSTPITLQPATSRIYAEPKGVVVIFSPWNYPFNLIMVPLIGAIAAGNCVILKPSHETPHIANVIKKIISETFEPAFVSTVMGEGQAIGSLLLDNFRFDHIFFTGSPKVGSWIMAKAARTLTPVSLELGGKSPAIVDKTAKLKVAVNRIVWSKYMNAGQTCLSSDYILVHEDIKELFVEGVKSKIKEFYGENPQKSSIFTRLVNTVRFDKICTYLDQGNILYGGKTDREDRYIEPTIMEVNDPDQPIMKEEIFGPIMPVITWKTREELIQIIRRNRYPLACYIFTEDKNFADYVIEKVEFGGGCINDVVSQYGNSNLPFGGIQTSGLGKYHGKYSFDTFSNLKPILKTATWIDPDFRYPPYTAFKMKLVKWVLE